MANLTNKQIKDTYNSLLKLEDNGDLSATRKEITDGLGNGSNVKINNLGSLEAAEFVKTGGLSTEYLMADGSVDTSTYLTSFTETDPLFTASPANDITTTDLSNYDDAYSWGDHSLESYATEAYVTTQINDVLDSAPAALDTLNELAAAIGDDADFAGTMTTALAGKASSSHTHDIADLNDFSVASEADENLFIYNSTTSKWENKDITDIASYNNTDWDTAYANRLDYSTQGYITESSLDSATDSTITSPADGEALLYNSTTSKWENSVISTTDTNHYLDGATFNDTDGVITMTVNGESDVTVDIDGRYSLDNHGHSLSSTSDSGFMSSDQFDKLDGIEAGANLITDNNQIANSAGYITSYVDTNTQRTDEEIEDVVGNMVTAGTGITVDYADPTGVLTITNNVTNSNTVTRISGDDTNYLTGDVDIVGGTNVTVTQAANEITITSTDTNTQRSNQDIDDRIALNPEGFITSYVDTNTQLTDAEIGAFGYIKTDTNTQRTDSEIDARIALNPEGFITSYVDTNTQRTDEDIRDVTAAQLVAGTGISITENDPSNTITITNDVVNTNTVTRITGDNSNFLTGDVKIVGAGATSVSQATNEITITSTDTNTNTQRTDADINALIAANPEGFITSYVDTNTQRSDEEIRDLASGQWINGTNTTVVKDDANNTIKINSVNTDTNTQRSDEDIRDVVASMLTGGTGITVTENDPSNTLTITNDVTNSNTVTRISGDSSNYLTGDVEIIGGSNVTVTQATNEITISATDTNTNTQLTDAQIAAMGYIKTDTNTTYSVGDGGLTEKNFTTTLKNKLDGITAGANLITNNNQISNGAGYITSYTDTNTQLSDAQIAAMGYIKTDTNTTYSVGDGGLTEKNFTTTLKNKLDGITAGANLITNNNQISNGAGYITSYTDTNTTYSAGSYINLSGTTFNLDTSVSGNRWGKAMHIGSDGGMEVGYYMDFHLSDGDTSDYAARLIASSNKLSVTGNFHSSGTITAAGDVIAYYSDERLKKDFEVIPNALDKVKAISGYTYYANEVAEELDIYNIDKQVGFKAQELLEVMPELVRVSPLTQYAKEEKGREDLGDILTLDYTKLTPLLVEAIKDQDKRIDILEDKLANKNNEYIGLLKRIEQLENK